MWFINIASKVHTLAQNNSFQQVILIKIDFSYTLLSQILRQLHLCNNFKIHSFICRTDKGVHALYSSAHVDMSNKSNVMYNPNWVLMHMNKYLNKFKHDIR